MDGSRVEPVERFRAVGGQLHLVTLERERPAQRLANRRFVVDDEDLCRTAHACIVASKIESGLRGGGGLGGTVLVAGARWSVAGKDAGSVNS